MEDRAAVEVESVSLREADGNAAAAESFTAGAGAGAEPYWLTIDGPLGLLQQEEALKVARSFFYGGFCLLPWLWFMNCIYFWPLLRHRRSGCPRTLFYVVWSGVGCLAVTVVLLAWSLTFAIGGERVVGSSWKHLAVYNLADKYAMAWSQ